MRDGNGPRGLDILARYRGSLLAELFRSLAALDARQAAARSMAGAAPAVPELAGAKTKRTPKKVLKNKNLTFQQRGDWRWRDVATGRRAGLRATPGTTPPRTPFPLSRIRHARHGCGAAAGTPRRARGSRVAVLMRASAASEETRSPRAILVRTKLL